MGGTKRQKLYGLLAAGGLVITVSGLLWGIDDNNPFGIAMYVLGLSTAFNAMAGVIAASKDDHQEKIECLLAEIRDLLRRQDE